ncbi:hypothetical protein BX600DRAFT_554161 [Xylariales sp. PMI_506]|nr:hypothetical protein BX600DRAFT_554161 [Xylariales sp. PMI_506]
MARLYSHLVTLLVLASSEPVKAGCLRGSATSSASSQTTLSLALPTSTSSLIGPSSTSSLVQSSSSTSNSLSSSTTFSTTAAPTPTNLLSGGTFDGSLPAVWSASGAVTVPPGANYVQCQVQGPGSGSGARKRTDVESTGSITQTLSNLTTGVNYTLFIDYSVSSNAVANTCLLTALFAGVAIDTTSPFDYVASNSTTDTWTRLITTIVFTSSSGDLEVEASCDGDGAATVLIEDVFLSDEVTPAEAATVTVVASTSSTSSTLSSLSTSTTLSGGDSSTTSISSVSATTTSSSVASNSSQSVTTATSTTEATQCAYTDPVVNSGFENNSTWAAFTGSASTNATYLFTTGSAYTGDYSLLYIVQESTVAGTVSFDQSFDICEGVSYQLSAFFMTSSPDITVTFSLSGDSVTYLESNATEYTGVDGATWYGIDATVTASTAKGILLVEATFPASSNVGDFATVNFDDITLVAS